MFDNKIATTQNATVVSNVVGIEVRGASSVFNLPVSLGFPLWNESKWSEITIRGRCVGEYLSSVGFKWLKKIMRGLLIYLLFRDGNVFRVETYPIRQHH